MNERVCSIVGMKLARITEALGKEKLLQSLVSVTSFMN
jgi:hypothetical protein